MAAWPRTSSGLVGSSIQYGSNSASALVQRDRLVDVPALVGVDRDADVRADGRAGDAACGGRRPSRSAPTFSLIWVKPSATASRGEPGELLVVVAEPAGRGGVGGVAAPPAGRACALGRARPGRAQQLQRLLGGERVGEVAEVDQGDEPLGRRLGEQPPQRLARRRLAARSHTALTTAPIAMCITPFSGPSQRSWLSPIRSRSGSPGSAHSSSTGPADHVRRAARRSRRPGPRCPGRW